MKYSKKIGVLFLCLLMICTSCGAQENAVKLETTDVLTHVESNIEYSLIDTPMSSKAKNVNEFWGGRMPLSENLQHIFCLFKDDKVQWKSYSIEAEGFIENDLTWGSKVEIEQDDEIVNIVQDADAGNTYICALQNQKYFLYHYSETSGEVYKTPIQEKVQLPKHGLIEDMLITPQNELVFFTSVKVSSDKREYGSTILYDPINHKILSEQEYISPETLCFGEDRTIYYLDEYQNCIIEKKFGSDDIQSVIPCEGLCQLDWNSKLDVKDGVGAIYTTSGIFTGKMTGEDWHKVLVPADYYKNEQEYYVNDFVMVPGEECEYYVFIVLDDNETVKWVHYY